MQTRLSNLPREELYNFIALAVHKYINYYTAHSNYPHLLYIIGSIL